MDPNLATANLVDPLAKLVAVGTAITILTEIFKQYVPEDKVPPPIIAAAIASFFCFLWVMSQDTPPTWKDSLSIALTWITMLQSSVAIYHGSQIASTRRRRKARGELPDDKPIETPPAFLDRVDRERHHA